MKMWEIKRRKKNGKSELKLSTDVLVNSFVWNVLYLFVLLKFLFLSVQEYFLYIIGQARN